MTASTIGRPRQTWAGVVRLSTCVLPHGATRDRFRQELVAEMYEMHPHEQRRHAFSVVAHAWSLRTAAAGGEPREREVAMRKSIRCLAGRHHDVWVSTEDGDRYRRCERCGRDNIWTDGGPDSAMGSSGAGPYIPGAF